MPIDRERPRELFRLLLEPHPWHGVSLGAGAPGVMTVYLEIVPTDTLKYELDKASGHLQALLRRAQQADSGRVTGGKPARALASSPLSHAS